MQGSLDADRLASLHVPVTQLQTAQGFGGECHLDANMVRTALPSIPLDEIDLLVIENVGNLVCPAEFRVGEDARVMVASVTEGEDKPLKYPLMFRACELVVLNKIDLLPHVDFDVERWRTRLRDRASGRDVDGDERAHGRGRGRVPRLARRAAGAPHGGGVTPERTRANTEFFTAESARLAALCDEMAQRFAARRAAARGGRRVRRAPRRGRVRPSGDRRQAGAAGARAPARGAGAGGASPTTSSSFFEDAVTICDEDVRSADRRPVRPPGADRDALPRALGARARVPRAPRDARPCGAGAAGVPLSVPRRRRRRTSTPCARTCAARSRPRPPRSARCASRRSPENDPRARSRRS